jgi:tetratricopeptide (TPR) repeat protein
MVQYHILATSEGVITMPTPFLSSEEYDERAHQLYNEGQYDEALDVLREGLALYPNSVELHIGVGYAYHAREEYAWARRSFEEALVLDPDHEDALAGLGETLLKFGQHAAALKSFHRTLELGYQDDLELMLQIGRALFRDGFIEESKQFFEIAARQSPDAAEAVSCIGYAEHRMGSDDAAIATLRRALQLDPDHAEARIYLGNIFYDRGDYEAALYHLDRSTPDDHWDELGIWRLIELKKMIYRLRDGDPELKPWEERLKELGGELDDIDEMLAEIEAKAVDAAQTEARGQLELFGALLNNFTVAKVEPAGDAAPDAGAETEREVGHRVTLRDGYALDGTWEQILEKMRAVNGESRGNSIAEFMATEAHRGHALTGVQIPTADAESFIRGSATAGLLRIVR